MPEQQIDVSETPDAQEFFKMLCNHLVCFCGTYIWLDEAGEDVGEEKFFAYSGFALSVRRIWCLVTAGHVIEDLEKPRRQKKIRVVRTYLADYFGTSPKVEEPTPFDYEGAELFCVDDQSSGLDFALLALRPFYRDSLEANGILAIAEKNWINQHRVTCEAYCLVGFPQPADGDSSRLMTVGDRKIGFVNPVLISVKPKTLPPEQMPSSTYPWFVGEIGASAALPTIVGMSGGPIFGFAKDSNGRWRYWIVAMQSWWRRQSRTIFGCPVPVFANLVENELQRMDELLLNDSTESPDVEAPNG